MCSLSNLGCKIIFMCSVNFWHQQDSNSLFIGSIQCPSQKIVLEGQSGPYNPFLGARYFKKGPMYQYLSNMQKRRSSWKVKEMKMSVYLKLTWSVPFYTQ